MLEGVNVDAIPAKCCVEGPTGFRAHRPGMGASNDIPLGLVLIAGILNGLGQAGLSDTRRRFEFGDTMLERIRGGSWTRLSRLTRMLAMCNSRLRSRIVER